jgi:hypothetical protein
MGEIQTRLADFYTMFPQESEHRATSGTAFYTFSEFTGSGSRVMLQGPIALLQAVPYIRTLDKQFVPLFKGKMQHDG